MENCTRIQGCHVHRLYMWRWYFFLCPPVVWRFQTSDLLPSSEIRVDIGIRSWKSTYQNQLNGRRPLVIYISQTSEELRLYERGLEFDSLKPLLNSCIFKGMCWLNGSFFRGDGRDFLSEGVNTYISHHCRLWIGHLLFCLHMYSLWALVT